MSIPPAVVEVRFQIEACDSMGGILQNTLQSLPSSSRYPLGPKHPSGRSRPVMWEGSTTQ